MNDEMARHPIPGIAFPGQGDGGHGPEQPWFYLRGQVVGVTADRGRFTIEPQFTALSQGQVVEVTVDGETAMESRSEGRLAGLAIDDISLGDVLAVEGPTLEMTRGRPVLRARWVAREKTA